MYQPSPFGEEFATVRGDCPVRYSYILNSFSDENGIANVDGLNILDFGCAEGYFGLSFLKDGAKSCTFVDHDEGCLKVIYDLAVKHEYSSQVKVYPSIKLGEIFNVVLCLDLWSEPKVPQLEDFCKVADILFISTSGNGDSKSPKLKAECDLYYGKVTKVHCGYENRVIYRCEDNK